MKVLLSAIYPYIYLLLFFTIPFDNYTRALPNILLIALVLAFPFVVNKEDFKKIKTAPFILFTVFCVYLIGDALFFNRLDEDFTVIKKILLCLGLVLLYIPIQDFEKIKKAIIFSSFAAIVFSVINIVVLINTNTEFYFGNSAIAIEGLLIDRLYLGFLCVLSIMVSYDSLKPKFHPINRYYLANIIINILFVFLIVSRISILLLVFLLLIRQLYGKNKKIRIPFLIITTIIIVALYFFGIHNIETKKKPTKLNNFVTNTTTWEIRSVTWECAVNTIKKNPFLWGGLGFYNTKDNLISCYENSIVNTYKRNQFILKRYNTHNQFLDFYLSTGIIGLLLFTLFILTLFIKNRNTYFFTSLLAVLVVYCMVENVFQRQMGAYYIGFILIILLSKTNRNQINTIKEG